MSHNATGEIALTVIDQSVLQRVRQRRSAGESLKTLAAEVGLTWQRLWGLLYSQPSQKGQHLPRLEATCAGGRLTEKYRPLSLDAIWGQESVVKVLTKFASQPYSTSMLFEGPTGTGKTSAALALAAALGCDLQQQEFGGVQTIASGEQSADAVRETCRLMWNTPMYGSGWKVVIVNEADRMHPAAETVWLDRLESLPPRTVVIFTTNYTSRLSQRFMDRCTRLAFESNADALRASATQFAAALWRAETGKQPDPARIQQIVQATESEGHLSFRRLVQALTVALGSEGAQ